jgi:hypothetical protein
VKPDYVYVASSWRCPMQQGVVAVIRAAQIEVYDFRNPPNRAGFGWNEVMPNFDIDFQSVRQEDYLAGLAHPIAEAGFDSDFDAMKKADTFVLVLPCGRSAHLRLGCRCWKAHSDTPRRTDGHARVDVQDGRLHRDRRVRPPRLARGRGLRDVASMVWETASTKGLSVEIS